MANLHQVFVYGTLKRGEPNHHWLFKAENAISNFICEAKTQEKYPLVIATKYNIPFLLHKPGTGHNVEGELYEVDDATFENLDELEGYPNFYIREQKSVLSRNKTEYKNVWIYFLKEYKKELLEKPMLKFYNDGINGLKYMESNNESTIEDVS